MRARRRGGLRRSRRRGRSGHRDRWRCDRSGACCCRAPCSRRCSVTADAGVLAPYVVGALSAGGVGVLASRRRELVKRWCTWVVTAPVVGGSLALGRPGAAALACGLGVVAAWEYARLAKLSAGDRAVLTLGLVIAPTVA